MSGHRVSASPPEVIAHVERVSSDGGGAWRLRCGNAACRSREHGRPLARGRVLAVLRGYGEGRPDCCGLQIVCPRCGAVNVVATDDA
jgi:hypothetical protein